MFHRSMAVPVGVAAGRSTSVGSADGDARRDGGALRLEIVVEADEVTKSDLPDVGEVSVVPLRRSQSGGVVEIGVQDVTVAKVGSGGSDAGSIMQTRNPWETVLPMLFFLPAFSSVHARIRDTAMESRACRSRNIRRVPWTPSDAWTCKRDSSAAGASTQTSKCNPERKHGRIFFSRLLHLFFEWAERPRIAEPAGNSKKGPASGNGM
jgi:hypothetical protein